MKKLSILIIITGILSFYNVYAEDIYVKDKGIKITSENVSEHSIDLSKLMSEDIKSSNGNSSTSLGEEYVPILGKTYTATYPQALNYYGKILTLKLELKLKSTYNSDEIELYNKNKFYSNNNRLNIIGHTTKISGIDDLNRYEDGTRFEVKYSFFDENNNPFKYTGLIGFIDPDGGNYYFNTNRDIYYKDASDNNNEIKFSECYFLTNRGIERDIENCLVGFDNATVYIALTNEETFTIELAIKDDWIAVPYLYGLVKEFNINYILNDGINNEENPSTYSTGNEIDILNPTREGYKFLGWEEGNKIEKWEFGDKTFTAKWEKIQQVEVEDTDANSNIYFYLFGIISLSISLYAFYSVKEKKI